MLSKVVMLTHILELIWACTLSALSSCTLRDDALTWCLCPFESVLLRSFIKNRNDYTSFNFDLLNYMYFISYHSTISTIISDTIGIHYGHILNHFKVKIYSLSVFIIGDHYGHYHKHRWTQTR